MWIVLSVLERRNVDNHATPDRGQENVVDMIDVVNRGPRVTGTGYLTRIAQYLAGSPQI